MRVTVDRDLCEGHGLCCAAAPAVFELDDDFEMQIVLPVFPTEHQEAVERALASCPRQALTVLTD